MGFGNQVAETNFNEKWVAETFFVDGLMSIKFNININ